MLQQADGMGHLQKILMQITLALVVLSVVLCATALGYLIGYGKEPVKEALSFTVVLLVASIPIAIEIVCTTTLALGSRQLSQEGAIVTRLASIEEMAGMNMLCSDKTGTLTLNKMVIQDDCPIYTAGAPARRAGRPVRRGACQHERRPRAFPPLAPSARTLSTPPLPAPLLPSLPPCQATTRPRSSRPPPWPPSGRSPRATRSTRWCSPRPTSPRSTATSRSTSSPSTPP
jgi:hypothetical protein